MNVSSLFTLPNLTDPENIEANRLGQLTPQQRAASSSPAFLLHALYTAVSRYGFVPVLGLVAVMFLVAIPVPWQGTLIGLAVLFVIVSVLVIIAPGLLTWTGIRRDIQAEKIEHADGRLVYGRAAYEPLSFDGKPLRLPPGWSGLEPGVHYRFYYLPESTLVVSAEDIQKMSGIQAIRELQQALAAANRFSVDDLPENRDGRMTSRQVKRVIPRLALGLALTLPVAFMLIYLLYHLITWSEADATNLCLGVLMFGLFGGVFGVIGLLMIVRAVREILAREVAVAEGTGQRLRAVSRSARNQGSTISYYYQVGEQKVRVPERAYRALINGLRYRMFYSPRTGTLMSIEPLDSPADVDNQPDQDDQPWAALQAQ